MNDPRPNASPEPTTEPRRWRYLPAADLELRGLDRLASTRRETGFAGAVASDLCAHAMSAYLRTVHRLRVEGREHVGRSPPAVIVANHASHLDAPAILAALRAHQRRATYVVAAADRFFRSRSRAGPAATLLNALALRRGRGGRHELAHLRARLLAEPCRLIVFPEGTRSRTGRMGPVREGVGVLVAGTGVPVIPCFLSGAHDALPPGARWPRPARLVCRFGPPLAFPEVPDTREGWRTIASEIERAIRALG